MQDVAAIAREIVAREGGYVNDPDDPGGATKHGVTVHTMRRLGLDLDGDGLADFIEIATIEGMFTISEATCHEVQADQ